MTMANLRKASQRRMAGGSTSKKRHDDSTAVHKNKERSSFRNIFKPLLFILVCCPLLLSLGRNLKSQLTSEQTVLHHAETTHPAAAVLVVGQPAAVEELPSSSPPAPVVVVVSEEQSTAGRIQIQESHASAFNRYPDEYSSVEKHFHEDRNKKNKKMKFLSFGAANGMEAITLAAMYFNDTTYDDAKVFGVDLHQPSLDQGKATAAAHNDPKFSEGKITFFNGEDTSISVHGPYDAIFANSVLCYHGSRGVNPQSIVERYPFANFEASLGYLDGSLKVGGLLAVVNSNYHFSDTKISKKYRAISKCYNFVPKVNVDTISYEKVDLSALDCVWVKESA